MLRILPLADDLILPQAKQEIYFFNRIGRYLPVVNTPCAGQVARKRLASTNAIYWSVAMTKGGRVECNSPRWAVHRRSGVVRR